MLKLALLSYAKELQIFSLFPRLIQESWREVLDIKTAEHFSFSR
jgi:hypothetical protein